MMRLYGTTTSPYVRRVHVVALELGVPFEWVDTATDAGQAALRAFNPLWKVPAVELDGRPLFDSRVIIEQLMREHGPGPLAAIDAADVDARNMVTVIDGALDALINTLYLQRDGVTATQASYVAKQRERAAAALAWVEARVGADGWLTRARAFGVAELGLVTALDWMRFRQMYPIEQHPVLMRCLEQHGGRESLVATRPG